MSSASSASSWRFIATAGFAMFSMFFGSGNLVFPLEIGQIAKSEYIYAIIGWCLTAVAAPVIGLLSTVKYNGDRNLFFRPLGKAVTFVISLIVLSLIGPFGVIPRCITVAHGGIELMWPACDLAVFSAGFCALLTLLIWFPNKIVDLIGVVLTPLKLGGIAFLIVIGLWFSPDAQPGTAQAADLIKLGALKGYQTMDLVGGIIFSASIVAYLHRHSRADQVMKQGVKASLLAGALLTLVYIGFIVLSGRYGHLTEGVSPQCLLSVISQKAFGDIALPVVGFTMAVSCLATATILMSLWVDFFREDICRDKISREISIILNIGLVYAMSLLGFQKIGEILGQMLNMLYPLLFVFAVYRLFGKEKGSVAHA